MVKELRKARYQPARHGGEKVRQWVYQLFTYRRTDGCSTADRGRHDPMENVGDAERLLLAGLVVLFVVFFVILIVQPTSVGRGGR